jgi:TonB family protein
MSATEILAASAWKGTIILAAAILAAAALRRQSAAVRHFLWSAAFAALLLLPAAAWMTPRWGLEVPVAAPTAPVIQTSSHPPVSNVPARPVPSSRTNWLLWLWTAGMVAASARFAAGALRTNWMVRRSQPFTDLGGIRVLLSGSTSVPLAWGIRKPVVLLPAQAGEWPEARLRTVLLHEREHVLRRDLLAQVVAQAACALYWFHPLAWWAMRELRKERERACDDAVLSRGVAAPDYAGHLVDVLREAAARRNRWADAPAMAEPSDFESRVRALLDRGRNRTPLSRRAAATLATAALLCAAPIALIHAQTGRAALAGVVTDPSGARIPGAKVIAKNADGSHEEVATADAAGEYAFASIPEGQYTLEVMSRGFAVAHIPVTLTAGAAAQADAHLALGSVAEQMTIEAKRTTPAPAVRPAGPPQRIRVGGNVTPARLIHQAHPAYPDELKNAGIQGSVVIRAVISKDGSVLNPVVVNTVDPRLAQAALDAVKQWAYEPTLLNGEPVEFLTTITMQFRLAD